MTTKRKTDELLGIARRLYEDISENEESMEGSCKPTNTNKEERFKKWIQNIDKSNFMNIAIEAWFGKQISSHADTNWFTWQCTRLWFAYIIDWCHKKSLRGSSEKKDISNDFYDMEPVLYLLRADGFLTNDTELEIPLAKAAFPNKDLFVVDTRVNDPRKVQDVFDDIVNVLPPSYRI